jgi:hypothetical protein
LKFETFNHSNRTRPKTVMDTIESLDFDFGNCHGQGDCLRDCFRILVLSLIVVVIFVLIGGGSAIGINYAIYRKTYNFDTGCKINQTCTDINKILCYNKDFIGCFKLSLIGMFCMFMIIMTFGLLYWLSPLFDGYCKSHCCNRHYCCRICRNDRQDKYIELI